MHYFVQGHNPYALFLPQCYLIIKCRIVNVADTTVDAPTPLQDIPLKIEDNPDIDDYAHSHSIASTISSLPSHDHHKRKLDSSFSELHTSFWDESLDPNSAVPMSPTQLLSIFNPGDPLDTPKTPPLTSGYIPLPPSFQPKIMYPQLDSSQCTAEIRTYAPDSGPMQESTRILVCVHGFSFFDQHLFPFNNTSGSQPAPSHTPAAKPAKRKKAANVSPSSSSMSSATANTVYYYSFWCVFDFGTEVPATVRISLIL